MKMKVVAVLTTVAASLVLPAAVTVARADPPRNEIYAHALDIELGKVKPKKYEQPLSGGVV
jgi:hypothetical protein